MEEIENSEIEELKIEPQIEPEPEPKIEPKIEPEPEPKKKPRKPRVKKVYNYENSIKKYLDYLERDLENPIKNLHSLYYHARKCPDCPEKTELINRMFDSIQIKKEKVKAEVKIEKPKKKYRSLLNKL